jgi:MFS family permease
MPVTAHQADASGPTGSGWDRSTAVLLAAYLATSTASMALVTAAGKQAYDMTGRELDLGLLGLAEFIPAAVLVLVTGAVADRYDRRRVGSIAVLVEALAALLFAAYAGSAPTAIAPLLGFAVLFGVGRAFAAPSLRSLPADIVAPERLPWLVARWAITWQSAMIIGPVAAGFLYAVDVRAPYVLAAVLFGLAAVALPTVRSGAPGGAPPTPAPAGAPAAAPRPGLRDALDGLRFVRRQPVLLGAISLDLFAVLFGGALALLPAVAEDRLGVGAVGFGWLRAANGIGAAAVTGVLAFRPLYRHVGRTLLAAVALFGAATIVLGVTTHYAVAFAAIIVASGADALSVFVRTTLVPLVTPANMRGRVLSVENVFIGASNELGAFESGVVGQLLGPALAIGLGGVATLVVAATWWVVFPALRKVDRFPVRAQAP